VAAGVLIVWRDWRWADPLFSVLISLLIIFNAWRLVIESVNVLLEGTPAHLNLAAVEQAMREVVGVLGVHDLHIWTLTSSRYIITAHVVVRDSRDSQRILRDLRKLLAERFALDHATLQLEEPAQIVNIQSKKS
jgi:cobalt-zinc-cadmium efflux system protein